MDYFRRLNPLYFFFALGVVVFLGFFFYEQSALVSRENEANISSGDELASSGSYRIALLGSGSPSITSAFEGFTQKMEEIKTSDAEIEYIRLNVPVSQENIGRAAEYLLAEDFDLIVTGQAEVAELRKKITQTPIIAVLSADSVGSGLAESGEGSGNNVVFIETGVNLNAGKRLEFFLELMPKAKRILVLRGDESLPGISSLGMKYLSETVRAKGVTLVEKKFKTRKELNTFFLEYDFSNIDALYRYPDVFVASNLDLFFAFQARVGKPFIVLNREELNRGGVLFYGPKYEEFGRVGAAIGWQILKKQLNPASVPIQIPPRYELGVNEGAARAFNLSIPQSLREKADVVIP